MRVLESVSAVSLAAVLGWAWAGQPQEETWIVSGQSNAFGTAPLPGPHPDPKVQMFDEKDNAWITAREPLAMIGRGVGAWHTAAVQVAQSSWTIRLMGYAQGDAIQLWMGEGICWTRLAANIQKCGEHAGVFLWYQGEANGVAKTSAQDYEARLKELVARVRECAKNPQMLAVIIQLGASKLERGDFIPIREAQRQFVMSDGNALLVPALGRSLKDACHLGKDAYFELGGEIARALLKTRYNQKNVNWPGPVLDAALLSKDGNTAWAHFAEVRKLANCEPDDFVVIDKNGAVKCLKATAGNTRVLLTLERPVVLPATLIYGFGQAPKASLVDEAGNRAPAVHMNVSQGAEPADSETACTNGAGRGPTEKSEKQP